MVSFHKSGGILAQTFGSTKPKLKRVDLLWESIRNAGLTFEAHSSRLMV
jgi:hypothetical protein